MNYKLRGYHFDIQKANADIDNNFFRGWATISPVNNRSIIIHIINWLKPCIMNMHLFLIDIAAQELYVNSSKEIRKEYIDRVMKE